MRTILAAVGLAVAVPVALAAPALAKPPASNHQYVSSTLRQHEDFRAEVTYRCTDPKDEEGTITVSLQKPAEPGASTATTVATAGEEAKCDGEEREETIKLPVAAGALHAGQTVQLSTTLSVDGKQVAEDVSSAVPVTLVPAPTPSPTATESQTPSPSPSGSSSPTASASATPSSSSSPSSPTESESPESETPSPSLSPSSYPTESESPESETPSTSPSPSEAESASASATPSLAATS